MNNHRAQDMPAAGPQHVAIMHLRRRLAEGCDWPSTLLEAMALWTLPFETYQERQYSYFIAGEAFDWLLLAERLCQAADGLIPEDEKEELLFTGQFPVTFEEAQLKALLGVEKYRGYLNYFYGVTVEEALQLAAEREVHKYYMSTGNRYYQDLSEEAFTRIYGTPRGILLKQFRGEKGYRPRRTMTLAEHKEFTYWLFEYRLKISDGAKIASDTRKAMGQLQAMKAAAQPRPLK